MTQTAGHFIVDGVFHKYPPTTFAPLTDDNFGVRNMRYQVFGGKRLNIVEAAQEDYPVPYAHKRRMHYQAWRVGWDGQNTTCDVHLYEQLLALYESQSSFWVQYDDEMSRSFGRCLAVGADLLDSSMASPYFTPTWPIFPWGYDPTQGNVDGVFTSPTFSWANLLMVGNQPWENEFEVNQEFGIITIQPSRLQFNHRIKVHLKYTWMAYVRIREFSLYPDQFAQTHYSGDVVFEQVRIPVGGAPLTWRVKPYYGSCVVSFRTGAVVVSNVIGIASSVTATVGKKQKISSAFAQVSVHTITNINGSVVNNSGKQGKVFAQLRAVAYVTSKAITVKTAKAFATLTTQQTTSGSGVSAQTKVSNVVRIVGYATAYTSKVYNTIQVRGFIKGVVLVGEADPGSPGPGL